jgi:hypothetical protein
MLKSLSRFAGALMRQPSAWFGFAISVLPVAEYVMSNLANEDMSKIWPPEYDVWLTFPGGLLLLWAAFRAWDREPSADSLRQEVAELKLQLAQQKRRYLTSDQRSALLAALKASDGPIRFNVVYDHLNDEAEEYARQFSAALLPERFAGGAIPSDDIPPNVKGVVLRVNHHDIPAAAQRLSRALTKAGIDHDVAHLTGVRASLVPHDYFDLAIGPMK